MKKYLSTLSLFIFLAGTALANEVDHKFHELRQDHAKTQLVFSEKLKILQNTQPHGVDTEIEDGLFIFKVQTYEVNGAQKNMSHQKNRDVCYSNFEKAFLC